MRNLCEHRGDRVVVFLRRRSGELLEAVVDAGDLPVIASVDGTWCACLDGNTFYASCHIYQGRKRTTIRMHNLILPAADGLVVDHINRNGLDNRRSNLRLVTIAENGQNRTLCQRNNASSGIRGVTRTKQGKWRAYFWHRKAYFHVGIFETIGEAESAVRLARGQVHTHGPEDTKEVR